METIKPRGLLPARFFIPCIEYGPAWNGLAAAARICSHAETSRRRQSAAAEQDDDEA
jgi:hypothetical protein